MALKFHLTYWHMVWKINVTKATCPAQGLIWPARIALLVYYKGLSFEWCVWSIHNLLPGANNYRLKFWMKLIKKECDGENILEKLLLFSLFDNCFRVPSSIFLLFYMIQMFKFHIHGCKIRSWWYNWVFASSNPLICRTSI